MLITLFFLHHILFVSPSFAQDILKTIHLDSVIVVAVKGGFSVEDFIYMVRQDTSFYKAFKNLHYYPYKCEGVLTVFNKSEKEKATLYKKATQYVKDKKRWMVIDEEKITGKMYDRKHEFNYYTAELFDFTFFPKDTFPANNIISDKSDMTKPGSKNQNYKQKLKILVFNPGTEVSGVPLVGNKLAIFDNDMIKYYDYKISSDYYNDSIPCYVFTCKVKQGLGYFQKDDPVIKELVSYFDKRTFNIVSRKYVLSYSSVLFDFDVTMNIKLKQINGALVPEHASYSGYWDIPFKSSEILSFRLKFYDHKIDE